MAQWLLVCSTVLAVLGGALGLLAVRQGHRSRWTLVCMVLAFGCQLGFLTIRGEMRGKCPLGDYGEILAFLAWSLVLFYLVVGPTYRISLLGLFTAPVVAIFQVVALGVPGLLEPSPEKIAPGDLDPWAEAHAAFSVLSYGAFALAAVAGLMFLVLNRQLKQHHLRSALFDTLPPVRSLVDSMVRLTVLGTVILTIGVLTGVQMKIQGGFGIHFVVASITWLAYGALLGVHFWRGMTPQRLSWAVIVLFAISLLVFAFV